ncbi:MAG: FAD-dependent oxidoreductase [Acidobacteria bacterium]|jgi:monoamine oxidase|nr:MAG: FAD-dependent oxidoreductase [Acidobacteriota bacterium]
MSIPPDIVIIGAGAAGLAAATELGQAGLAVSILDARNRIGGRIFTLSDPVCHAPVELGAEFIHGRPPEIWDLLKKRRVRVKEVDGDNWCVQSGHLGKCDFFSEVDEILKQMDDQTPDESFVDFLKHCCRQSKTNRRLQEAKERALSYVTGFNAADPSQVSVHWLLKGMRAEERIEGDRAFRAQHGYADLIEIFQKQLLNAGVSIQLGIKVDSIHWRPGNVEVRANGSTSFAAPRVLITLPLGVLRASTEENGAVRFAPDLPRQKKRALSKLAMGKVIRVTLRFRERFWVRLPKDRRKGSKTLAKMSFLFSQDDCFPTWWTTMPERLPIITGWAPFRCAERLSGQNEAFVVEQSLQTLNRLLGVSTQELESLLQHAYFHDWQNDPFSRGAYSHAKVGGDGAQAALASPIENTLFFAGEATDISGHNGTVHGAIASGRRAASEIQRSLRRGDDGLTRPG